MHAELLISALPKRIARSRQMLRQLIGDEPTPQQAAELGGELTCRRRLPEYHAVLISVGRALGICAQAILARGLGLPILGSESITLERLAAGTDAGTRA